MVERIICSTCNKASYTIANERIAPCPYCDFEMDRQSQNGNMRGISNQQADMMLKLNDAIPLTFKIFKSIKVLKSDTE